MNRSRLLVLVAGAVVVLLGLGLAVLFNSAFQTWALQRAIASRPDLHVSVGSVSAGINRVQLSDVRLVVSGAVLTLPSVELQMPLLPVVSDRQVRIAQLIAKGWTLDLRRRTMDATAQSDPAAAEPAGVDMNGTVTVKGTSAPDSLATAAAAAQAFEGIFAQLRLPVDLSVDGVQLEGDVILPRSPARAKVKLTGGGLGAGQDGRFALVAAFALADPGVNAVEVWGELIVNMDTPRSFTRLAARVDAAARGEKFPQGVKLHAEGTAARTAEGEAYAASVLAEGKEVFTANAALPRNAGTYGGSWKADISDIDVEPFALGVPLPAFKAIGEGKFDGDARFEAVHVAGRLGTVLGELDSVLPELGAVGELEIAADFDLAKRGGAFVVAKFEADVNGSQPVATVRSLQAFEFNPTTGELRTADTGHELIGLKLHAVPVAWVAPFLKDFRVTGGHIRGDLSAAARGGGMTLRSTSPLMVDGIDLGQAEQPLVKRVDLALVASADYTPNGWQAEVSEFKATSGDSTLFTLETKLGQLAGNNQAIKATGTLTADLPSLLAQPAAGRNVVFTSGDASLDFVLSLAAKKEVQADISLTDLATVVETNAVQLPAISTALRADISPGGKIALNAPVQIDASGRKSDLTFIGTIGPEQDRLRAIEATVTSTAFNVEDVQLLAAIFPAPPVESPPPVAPASPPAPVAAVTPVRDSAPPWAGWHGTLALQMKNILYSDALEVSDVTGRLLLDGGMLKLEALQAGLGETGRASLDGTVTFNPAEPQPYALSADAAVSGFDPALLFPANADQPATVEGRFDVMSKLDGRAAAFADLAAGAGGSFQFTSKGGVFRGIPVNVGNIVENTGKIAAWIASAGTAISTMAGKRDPAEVASKGEAVAELARGLYPIPYDQLSVRITRDAALNTTLRDFTLIAPEVRLTGSGTALHKPGSCLLEDSLAMEFTLRVRGRKGELLKYLGALGPQVDDLGYATFALPLRVGGTLGKPDATELNHQLTDLAIQRSGLGEKAAELLHKIRGGK